MAITSARRRGSEAGRSIAISSCGSNRGTCSSTHGGQSSRCSSTRLRPWRSVRSWRRPGGVARCCDPVWTDGASWTYTRCHGNDSGECPRVPDGWAVGARRDDDARKGEPHVNMTWAGLDGDEIVFASFFDAKRADRLRRDPRVTLSFQARDYDGKRPLPVPGRQGTREESRMAARSRSWTTCPSGTSGLGASYPARDMPARMDLPGTVDKGLRPGPLERALGRDGPREPGGGSSLATADGLPGRPDPPRPVHAGGAPAPVTDPEDQIHRGLRPDDDVPAGRPQWSPRGSGCSRAPPAPTHRFSRGHRSDRPAGADRSSRGTIDAMSVTPVLQPFVEGWATHQRLLLAAIADLSPEQLALRPAPAQMVDLAARQPHGRLSVVLVPRCARRGRPGHP